LHAAIYYILSLFYITKAYDSVALGCFGLVRKVNKEKHPTETQINVTMT